MLRFSLSWVSLTQTTPINNSVNHSPNSCGDRNLHHNKVPIAT